jgi:hypothetical protein
MHNMTIVAALLTVALGTTGCMQGFGALNAMTALMFAMPVPSQGDAVASNDASVVYVNNTTYVTNTTYVSGSSSTGSSRPSRPHRSHHSHQR